MDTMIQLLAAYGICFGLMNEKLPVVNRALYAIPAFRNESGNLFERMFACSFCTGFHAGWIAWLSFQLTGVGFDGGVPGMVMFAFASGAFCYSADSVIRLSDFAAEALPHHNEEESLGVQERD